MGKKGHPPKHSMFRLLRHMVIRLTVLLWSSVAPTWGSCLPYGWGKEIPHRWPRLPDFQVSAWRSAKLAASDRHRFALAVPAGRPPDRPEGLSGIFAEVFCSVDALVLLPELIFDLVPVQLNSSPLDAVQPVGKHCVRSNASNDRLANSQYRYIYTYMLAINRRSRSSIASRRAAHTLQEGVQRTALLPALNGGVCRAPGQPPALPAFVLERPSGCRCAGARAETSTPGPPIAAGGRNRPPAGLAAALRGPGVDVRQSAGPPTLRPPLPPPLGVQGAPPTGRGGAAGAGRGRSVDGRAPELATLGVSSLRAAVQRPCAPLRGLPAPAPYIPASLAPTKPPTTPATNANPASSSTNRRALLSNAAFAATTCAAPLLS